MHRQGGSRLKVIIAGSRGIVPERGRKLLRMGIEIARIYGIEITEVVCGQARAGMDKYTREWADENHLPVQCFGADYDTNRAMGGFIRNEELTQYGDALIAITNGTTGIAHLIHSAQVKRIPVVVISVPYV
jgi:hypothetical protein